MKNLKKLLCMVLCIALMSTAVFAAPQAGSLCEIYDPIVEIGNPMTGNDTMAKAATSPVTFSDTSLNYDRDTFGTNLKREFVAGRSGAEGDYAMKISANVSNAFGGLGSLNACGWRMFYDDVADAYQATVEGKPVVVEFDIKVDTTCDIYGLFLYRTWAADGNDSYYIFNADGKIVGTDYAYEANKWYHFRWEIDGKKAYVDITPDGGETERIVNGAWSTKGKDNTYQGTFFLTQETTRGDGDTKAGMTIDNWRHYYYTKPASGTVVSPEGNAVSGDENFIFRVTAEAEEGDEIDLRVDGTSIATFDAEEGIYDYAADVDHCSIDAGAHVLSAYKVTDGFEEKIAEKIVSVSGRYAGAIPTNKGTYPTGVETFDNLDKYLLTNYLSNDGTEAIFDANVGGGIMEDGASGLPGDKSAYIRSFGQMSAWKGLHIIDNNTWFTQAGVFELEFDIKVATTTDSVALYGLGALWHDDSNANPSKYANSYHKTIFLNEAGKVSGTDVEYKANEWMHFKIQYNYDRQKWNVWKDSVNIVKDANFIPQDKGLNETYNYLVLSVLSEYGDGRAIAQLDNLSVHQYYDAPSIASVSYATDSASDIATTDLYVTDEVKSVTVTVDKAIDTVADSDVTVLVNGVAKAVSGVTYNADAKAVTVPLTGIEAGDSISVTIATKVGSASAGNLAFNLNVKATGLYIAQNKIIGSSIKTQMYNGGAAKEAMLVAVVFDGNRMTDVSIISETIPSGETVYTFPLKAAPGEKEVKLMVWDNGMQPILEKAAE